MNWTALEETLNLWSNPVTYAIPVFLLTIAIELAALKWLDHDDNVTGYMRKDAMTSIWMGVGSLVSTLVLKAVGFTIFILLYTYAAPWHLPGTWWSLALAIVLGDFLYYWQHRFVHRARVGWAAHQAHHSSEYMNFATALRQKWNPWFDLVFWMPMPLLGISPQDIYIAFGVNLIFQFFVHTELIGKLWAPIEFVFNTPSHHRVHHGSDKIYLDKNYAGMLIIWDRMFGTFQVELQRPTYGLTYKVDTYNLIKLEYGHYAALWRDVRNASSWREKISYLLMPPGWEPVRAGSAPSPEPVPAPKPRRLTRAEPA